MLVKGAMVLFWLCEVLMNTFWPKNLTKPGKLTFSPLTRVASRTSSVHFEDGWQIIVSQLSLLHKLI